MQLNNEQFYNGQLYKSYNGQHYNGQSPNGYNGYSGYNGIGGNTGINGGFPSPGREYPSLDSPEDWDYGLKRLVPILESPPLGAGILAITFFFFVMFLANPLLAQVNLVTLGIVVTIATFILMGLTVLILFLL